MSIFFGLGVVLIWCRFPQDVDFVALAENMRPEDVAELEAVTNLRPCEALILSIQKSDPDFLRAWFVDGELVGIGGCSPVSVTRAAPWFLGTPVLDRHGLALTKYARAVVDRMLLKYAVLHNVVDVRQERVLRWLEALGFVILHEDSVKEGFLVWHFERRAV